MYKHKRLKEIDDQIKTLKASLKSASGDRKDSIAQEIEKWGALRGTIQRTLENKAKCDKYFEDERLDFGSGRRNHSSKSKFVDVHTGHHETRQNTQRAAQSAAERGEALSRIQQTALVINEEAVDFEKAAKANADSNEHYFASSFLHFFRAICCCGSKNKESEPLLSGDEHHSNKTFG